MSSSLMYHLSKTSFLTFVVALAVCLATPPFVSGQAGSGKNHLDTPTGAGWDDTCALGNLLPLSKDTFSRWRGVLLPDPHELRWTLIKWHPSLDAGIRQAGKEGKPLLLWVMNGHPLGCT